MGISRRKFILGSLVACGGLTAGVCFLSKEQDLLPQLMIQLKKKPFASEPIALAYSSLFKKESADKRSQNILRSAVNDRLLQCAESNRKYHDSIGAFQTCISNDFLSGNIVKLNGWQLAKIEAEVYFLLSNSEVTL